MERVPGSRRWALEPEGGMAVRTLGLHASSPSLYLTLLIWKECLWQCPLHWHRLRASLWVIRMVGSVLPPCRPLVCRLTLCCHSRPAHGKEFFQEHHSWAACLQSMLHQLTAHELVKAPVLLDPSSPVFLPHFSPQDSSHRTGLGVWSRDVLFHHFYLCTFSQWKKVLLLTGIY